MPWSTSRPNGTKTADKYRDREYLATNRRLRAELAAAGTGICAEIICKYRSRIITPAMKLHLCHDRRTGQVLGLGHAACNLAEAGRAARARQNVSRLRW